MEKYSKYRQIKVANDAARYILSLIGRVQGTTSKDLGKLHKLSVSANIHYQKRDGAKNYHEDKRLNAALTQAATELFHQLRTRAKEIMDTEERSALHTCKYEVEELLRKIKEVEKAKEPTP